jgi:hypothetical protein
VPLNVVLELLSPAVVTGVLVNELLMEPIKYSRAGIGQIVLSGPKL